MSNLIPTREQFDRDHHEYLSTNGVVMKLNFTREQLAHLSTNGNIDRFDSLTVVAKLQGNFYHGRLEARGDGTAIVHFDTSISYFNNESFEITSPLNNNYVSHALEGLTVTI